MSGNSSAGSKVFVAVVVILFVVLLLALAWKIWHMRSSMAMAPMAMPSASATLAIPGATLTTRPGGQSSSADVAAMSAGSPMEYYGDMGAMAAGGPHYHQWDEPWSAAAAAGTPHVPHYHMMPPDAPAAVAASSGEGRFAAQPMHPQYAGAYDADFGGASVPLVPLGTSHMHPYEHVAPLRAHY